MPKRLSRKLRLLRDAQIVDDQEYMELLNLSKSRKRQTRKQKAASAKNLRRACKKICKPKSQERSISKTEQQVRKLRSEISETVRQERLKSELQELKAQRRNIREAKRALKDLDFSIL